jgi:hypothetical protein
MEAKRIIFERTGGFAGIRLSANVELSDLPQDQAHEILQWLDDMDFAKLPEQIMGKKAIPDGFSYSITIEYEEQQHTVITADASVPDKMQPLLDLLNQIARQQAKNKK